MAYPTSGIIKIFPSFASIISGQFALNSDVAPQPSRPVGDIDTYFGARVTNLAVAPCLRRETEIPGGSGIYVPVGGNYELQFLSSSLRIEFYDGAYPSPIIATLDFLDADFPMGMTLTQPTITWTGEGFFGPSRDRSIDDIIFKYGLISVYTNTPPSGALFTGSITTPTNAIIPSFLTKWSIVQLMKSFGLSISCNVVASVLGNTPRVATSEFFILAAYNTQNFAIVNNTPNVLPGEDAHISGVLTAFDIDQFRVYYDGSPDVNPLFPGWTGGVIIPRNMIFEFTGTDLKFRMPDNLDLPYGGRRLMLTGTASGADPFIVGEFPITNFNTTLVEGSGLYKLTPGQHHDTYYDRSVSPAVTVNLRIPNPSARTGFF